MKKLLIIIFVFMTVSAMALDRKVILKSTVKVNDKKVTLADVIHEDSHEFLTDEEKKIVLMTLTNNGARYFSKKALAYKMFRFKVLHDMILSGPARVTIMRVVDKERMDDVKLLLIEAIKEDKIWKDQKIDLEFSLDDQKIISDYDKSATPKIVSKDVSEFGDRFRLRVQFFKGKTPIGTSVLKPYLKRKIAVINLKTSVKKGTVISASDVYITETWISGRAKGTPGRLKDVIGYEIVRDKVSGSRIKFLDLVQPICVKRGGILTVETKVGGSYISLKAKAIKGGRRGETIDVLNISSGKSFSVTLTGKKLATLN